jgi:hypothetical protein
MILKSLLPVCLGLSVGYGAVAAQERPAADTERRFVGNWRLVTFENFDEKGVARPGPYDAGRIMYDAHGNMAAQLMRNGRQQLSTPPTDAERAVAYATFLSYYGRYTVDPSSQSVTHHVEGSTNPNWLSTVLTRYYAFSADGNRLMLSLRNAEGRVTGTLTWERLK